MEQTAFDKIMQAIDKLEKVQDRIMMYNVLREFIEEESKKNVKILGNKDVSILAYNGK